MKLVSDWKQAWKWNSAQVGAIIMVLPVAWMNFPPDLKSEIPESWMPWIIGAMGVAVVLGRLRDQP